MTFFDDLQQIYAAGGEDVLKHFEDMAATPDLLVPPPTAQTAGALVLPGSVFSNPWPANQTPVQPPKFHLNQTGNNHHRSSVADAAEPTKKRPAAYGVELGDSTSTFSGKRLLRGPGKAAKTVAVPTRKSPRHKAQAAVGQRKGQADDEDLLKLAMDRFSQFPFKFRYFVHCVVNLALQKDVDISNLDSPITAYIIAVLLHKAVTSLERMSKNHRSQVIHAALATSELQLQHLLPTAQLERVLFSCDLAQFIYNGWKEPAEDEELAKEFKQQVNAAMGEEIDVCPLLQTAYAQQQQQLLVASAPLQEQIWQGFVPLS